MIVYKREGFWKKNKNENRKESAPLVSADFFICSMFPAYLSRKEKFNLILLDWSELGPFPWYRTAVMNVKYVSTRLKRFIETFSDSGEVPLENLHIVGFSLGCHVAGIAGKLIRPDLRIPRITALDPALPEFSLNGNY